MNETSKWRQIDLWCGNWQTAEHMATSHLWPLLARAEDDGTLTSWWYVRKAESWRLRFRGTTAPVIDQLTNALSENEEIRGHAETIYEPETSAFGGELAMNATHTLFHADSRHVLAHLAQGHDYRRELAVLLGTRLLRAAGQDWYEQGDIWTRLADHRVSESPAMPSRKTVMAVQRLVTAADDTMDSPLHVEPEWPAAFERAGRELAEHRRQGHLTRGLRAVLAHHLLFGFNRLGVSARDQYLLAMAVCQVVFHQDAQPADGSTISRAHHQPTTVSPVTADTMNTTSPSPDELRAALVNHIRGRGTFRTEAVEAAFQTVPRHVFLPGVDLRIAYAPKPVVTKRADDGTAISSASSPNLVAEMLEQLAVLPSDHVLEIGAATGINAALLAELTGRSGHVVTIELDEDLAACARRGLAAAGYHQVEVICGDGALGYASAAPYERVIVTAGAWDISQAWWDQLALGGRLVVPLRLHGSGLTRAIAFDRTEPGQLTSSSALVCGFVPMRGVAEHDETVIMLADDVVLHVDANDWPDDGALSQALTHPARTFWTGIQIRDDEPVEHLDLWLLTNGEAHFGRLSVGGVARGNGLANPARRWAGAALYDKGTVAYLATRDVSHDVSELGIVGHGPGCEQLVDLANDLLHLWDRDRPAQPQISAFQAKSHGGRRHGANHVVRPTTTVDIAW